MIGDADGDPLADDRPLVVAPKADGQRRRLTIAPRHASSPSSGSRFATLVEEDSSEEDDCASKTPFEGALEVLDDASPQDAGWSTVMRRGRRSDEELAQDFWKEIGFPTHASRSWKKSSISSSVASSPPMCSPAGMPSLLAAPRRGGSSSSRSPPRGLATTQPVWLGWRGPLPRPRVTPPAVLGMFFPTSPTEELAAAIDVLPGAAVAGVVNRDGVADGVIGTELQISSLTNGPNCHMGSSSPWAYQGRRFAALWRNAKEPKASIAAPSVASTLTPRSSAASPPA